MEVDGQSIGLLHGSSLDSIYSIHAQTISLHRGTPPSLIQAALDAASVELSFASAEVGAVAWEPGVANTGCSAFVFSKFLHMQHTYETCTLEVAHSTTVVDDKSRSSKDVERSAAMLKRAREECGSQDWGTHFDDAKGKQTEAKSSKRAREECGSENWGTHLDDLPITDKASRANMTRTDHAAGPTIKYM